MSRQVVRSDRCFFRQRAVPPHEHAPAVGKGEAQGVVLRDVGKVYHDPEVDEPALEFFGHVVGVAAEKAERDVRIALLYLLCGAHHRLHRITLSAADAHFAAHRLFRRGEFLFRLFVKLQELFGALFEQNARLGQRYFAAPTRKEGAADLVFKVLHLFGERGLRNIQRLCRLCDVLFPRHRQKVT